MLYAGAAGDGWEWHLNLDEITHTARHQHQCAGCGLTVHTGERYVRAQVPGGGRSAKAAFHGKCYAGLVASASTLEERRTKEQ